MTFYTCAIILTELMMLTMSIHVIPYSGFTREQKKWYLLSFTAVMACAAAEYFAILFDAHGKSFIIPLTVITVIQFSITPLLPVFFSGALGIRRIVKQAAIFFSINVLAEIVSAPFGWIFYFDETGKYVRGEFYLIYEGFYIVSLVFLIAAMIIAGFRFGNRDRSTVIMILVVMVAGLIPVIFFKIYTDYVAIGFCAGLCYIYYNDLVQLDARNSLVADQQKLSGMQENTISGLANLIESRDTETGEHVARTREYVQKIAEFARKDGVYADMLDDHYISLLCKLAPMHDVGKIVVPDAILKKPGRLTDEEFAQMKRHAAEGGTVVRRILHGITDEEYLQIGSDIATCHHERWDGKGYPSGLTGEDIPLCARIMAIADVYDALISERCYKKAMPPEQAAEIIREEAGTHFDPALAKVFLDHKDEFIPD